MDNGTGKESKNRRDFQASTASINPYKRQNTAGKYKQLTQNTTRQQARARSLLEGHRVTIHPQVKTNKTRCWPFENSNSSVIPVLLQAPRCGLRGRSHGSWGVRGVWRSSLLVGDALDRSSLLVGDALDNLGGAGGKQKGSFAKGFGGSKGEGVREGDLCLCSLGSSRMLVRARQKVESMLPSKVKETRGKHQEAAGLKTNWPPGFCYPLSVHHAGLEARLR